jgi:hypothetical protein
LRIVAGGKISRGVVEIEYAVQRRFARPVNASQGRRAILAAMLALVVPTLYLVAWASGLNELSTGRYSPASVCAIYYHVPFGTKFPLL